MSEDVAIQADSLAFVSPCIKIERYIMDIGIAHWYREDYGLRGRCLILGKGKNFF
jgi:hypothetical protein